MFDPHPSCVVAPERAPRLLTSLDERCELIRGEGIEQILIQPFTTELAQLTPEEFATQFLRDGLGAQCVIVGENFRFGCKQAGDTQMLRELGSRLGFEVRLLETVRWRGRRVSSGEVRKLVAAGEVGIAGRLLERPYAISGEIVHGHGIGSKQTVPTLNLRTDSAGDSGARRVRHADDRNRTAPALEFDHQHRLPADLRQRRCADDRDVSAGSSGGRDARSGFGWSFCGGCATSGSSRVPRR